jgi:SusD family
VPPSTIMPTERGPYYWSNYWSSSRALNNHTQFPLDGGGRDRRGGNVGNSDLDDIQDAMLLPAEMDLLMAEAEIRLGNPAAAAALINKTRVGNGELPPVTAAGVTPEPGCVPKLYDGSCGTLMDALMYEKRIETYGTAISYFDLRGWGCLLEGTPTELPPPGRQLDLLGKAQYTYGGHPGTPGSAPRPTNCPLLHRP